MVDWDDDRLDRHGEAPRLRSRCRARSSPTSAVPSTRSTTTSRPSSARFRIAMEGGGSSKVELNLYLSYLGKPRRLSNNFLQEEGEKLEQYRESVRTHYAELRAGVKEGLPTNLARPLSVGQRASTCHPKTREIHDGSVLTVDRSRCRVQFDRPELGVEFVMWKHFPTAICFTAEWSEVELSLIHMN